MSTHGGYRHGRQRKDPANVASLHCYITRRNHQMLREIATAADLTHGEVLDKLIEGHIRRKDRKALVLTKETAWNTDNCQIQ